MNKRIFLAFLPLLLLSWAEAPCRADDDVYQIVLKKQEQKQQTRWSLQDWLDTRDRMRLMDLWLTLHSPSPYEFFLTGEYRFLGDQSAVPFNHGMAGFAAYATIFGLELEHSFSDVTETSIQLGVRAFGFSQQGTNLTLLGGMIMTSGLPNNVPLDTRNGVVGTRLTFYLTRSFGVDGAFEHLFASTPNSAGINRGSNRYQGGAFIDFRYLRLFGEYFNSSDSLYPSGYGAGFKFFF